MRIRKDLKLIAGAYLVDESNFARMDTLYMVYIYSGLGDNTSRIL